MSTQQSQPQQQPHSPQFINSLFQASLENERDKDYAVVRAVNDALEEAATKNTKGWPLWIHMSSVHMRNIVVSNLEDTDIYCRVLRLYSEQYKIEQAVPHRWGFSPRANL